MITRRTLGLTLLGTGVALAADWQAPLDPNLVDLEHFRAPEGLEVTVWASSPMLYNPTNLDIDAEGRIWVAEGVNYRRHQGRRPGGDRIVVLEDTDGDGAADSSHTFVQEKGLIAPLGVAVFDNRVVVSQPPDLIVYTDVDRDLRFNPDVDKREVLLTGFNAVNHDHSLHSVTGGPDGKWYFNNGNCGAVFTDNSGTTFRIGSDYYRSGGGEWPIDTKAVKGRASDDGHVWTPGFSVRMNPDGTDAEIIGHGYRNSYEQAVNSFGELFQNDNDDPPACRNSYVLEYGSAGYFTRDGYRYKTVRRLDQEHWRNHWRQDDPGTFDAGDVYGGGSPTGVVFYENGALGPEHAGTFLSCEAGRNVIFGYQPEMDGAGYRMERRDWLTSNTSGEYDGADFTGGVRKQQITPGGYVGEDNPLLFRPSDVAVGANGAIYVSDWFDPRVGGHADLDESCSGTIYRIAPKGFRPENPAIDLATLEGAVAALRSPAVNVRWTGFEALRERGEAALPAVLALAEDPDRWIAARALWLLPHLGEEGVARSRELLDAAEATTRMVAFRALKRAGHEVHSAAVRLAKDPVPALRREAALAMRDVDPARSAPVLVAVAEGWDGEDKNYLESIGLGAAGHEDAVWKALHQAHGSPDALEWSPRFAKLTWRLWPGAAIADLERRATAKQLNAEQRRFAAESLAFIDDAEAAEALIRVAAADGPAKAEATSWLLRRCNSSWSRFGLRGKLKEAGIYNPDEITLTEVTVPEPAEERAFTEAEVLALEGDVERGAALAQRCVMCHQIDGNGPAYGPDLRGWTARQGVAMTVRSIVSPSADIAHGFYGRRISLKDGTLIDGMIIADGDPLVVISTGGITQLVPAERIKDVDRLDRSLMLDADQLGLRAQDVADIVAWMKSY